MLERVDGQNRFPHNSFSIKVLQFVVFLPNFTFEFGVITLQDDIGLLPLDVGETGGVSLCDIELRTLVMV